MQLHNGLVEVNVSMKAARLGRGQVQTPIPGDLGHPLQAGSSRLPLVDFVAGKRSVKFRFPEAAIHHRVLTTPSGSSSN